MKKNFGPHPYNKGERWKTSHHNQTPVPQSNKLKRVNISVEKQMKIRPSNNTHKV